MGQASILPCRYSAILSAPNSGELIAEYASECSIEEIGAVRPHPQIYQALEASGKLQCFGVYEDEKLVGFASVLVSLVPHYSVPVATVESLFLSQKHRQYRLARALLSAVEQHALGLGCTAILYSAPAGSRFDRFLALLDDYRLTNSVYCRRLQ